MNNHEIVPSMGANRGIMGTVSAEAPNALSNETRQLMSDLNQTFADFRSANDERVALLEKGMADVVTEEKVDRINAQVTNLQEAHDSRRFTTA